MKDPSSIPSLDKTRIRVARTVRALRTENRWTQADLAKKLDLSQARLSEIERGDGSFTAEQLFEVLRLFNVDLDRFREPQAVEDELQNALSRLGAPHLREVSETLPSARIGSVRAAVREVLLAPRDSRLLLALGPVLLANLDALNLDVLHQDLANVGFPARVPWLVENVLAALGLAPVGAGRADTARRHRARTVLSDFASRHLAPGPEPQRPLDHLDVRARSERSLAEVRAAASEISHRWGVVSDLQPADFADAFRAANVQG